MITSSTTATLIPVMTMLALAESLVPSTSTQVITATISTAPQSKLSGPRLIVVSSEPPNWVNRLPRYSDQPLATTEAPSASSSTRSQPMIQAISSPRVA